MSYKPMLAKPFNIEKFKKYPVGISPKLDGVRCLAFLEDNEDEVILQSRTGKEFKFKEHIRDILYEILEEDIVLDGELYTHGLSFSNIIRLVMPKKNKPRDEERLHYYIFDCFGDGIKDYTYEERVDYLMELKKKLTKKELEYIKFVDYEIAETEDDVIDLHDKYAGKRYEGVMVRILDSVYQNKRSSSLMKYKNFKDDEFEVVDFEEGTGKDKGAIIFIVQYDEKRTFKVRPSETLTKRKQMYKKGSSYIGKMYTVRYQPDPISDDNLPRFPVGVAFRDYE